MVRRVSSVLCPSVSLLSRCLEVSYAFRLVLFVFKQKTAYEMRISDWSSDVCSSDLRVECTLNGRLRRMKNGSSGYLPVESGNRWGTSGRLCKIGRASCRERVCQYV